MTESELRIVDAWLAQAIIVDYYTGAALRHARNGNTLHLSAEHDPSDGPDLSGFERIPLTQ